MTVSTRVAKKRLVCLVFSAARATRRSSKALFTFRSSEAVDSLRRTLLSALFFSFIFTFLALFFQKNAHTNTRATFFQIKRQGRRESFFQNFAYTRGFFIYFFFSSLLLLYFYYYLTRSTELYCEKRADSDSTRGAFCSKMRNALNYCSATATATATDAILYVQ